MLQYLTIMLMVPAEAVVASDVWVVLSLQGLHIYYL